jgi:hypothetical protein
VQTFTDSNPSSTSSLVSAISVRLLSRTAWRSITQSSQPARRRRPVTVPYSRPMSIRVSPSASSSSVGNGPAPTRVVYALVMPTIRSMSRGPSPDPAHAPPAVGFDDVTYGIGAVVEVEERRLRTLEQHVLTAARRRAAGVTVSHT